MTTAEQQAAAGGGVTAELAALMSKFWWYAGPDGAAFKIQDKATRKMVTLQPNWAQRYAWRKMAAWKAAGELLRVAIPKPRQVGFTTAYAAEKLHLCLTGTDVEVYMLIHDLNPAAKLWSRVNKMYTNIRPDCPFPVPKLDRFATGREFHFETGSNILIESVRKRGIGRAETLDHVHATELPSWDNPEEILTGIEESVPDILSTSIILESTCEGVGDFWYWLVQKAKDRHENSAGYFLLFIPWWLEPFYEALPQRGELQKRPITPEERAIGLRIQAECGMYGVPKFTDEQVVRKLLWRRRKMIRRGADKFRQEYPMDVDEAFTGTGRPVFLAPGIDWHRARILGDGKPAIRQASNLLEVVQTGSAVGDRGKEKRLYGWRPASQGPFHLWEAPKPGASYVLGIDSATGSADDRSCIQVLKFSLPMIEQVAVWHGDTSTTELAYIAAFLGFKFNKAFLIPEVNDMGKNVVSTLVPDIRYPLGRIYHYEFRDQRNKKASKPGFDMNAGTRPQVIEGLYEFVVDTPQHLILRHGPTIAELAQFAYNKKGRPEAPAGGYDDCVMALGVGLEGRHSVGKIGARGSQSRGAVYEGKVADPGMKAGRVPALPPIVIVNDRRIRRGR